MWISCEKKLVSEMLMVVYIDLNNYDKVCVLSISMDIEDWWINKVCIEFFSFFVYY